MFYPRIVCHFITKNAIASASEKIIKPDDGVINVNILKQLIFPTDNLNYDVFISHSHNNLNHSQRLANFIKSQLGKEPFLDSFIWGSADGLLKNIDLLYCKSSNNLHFDYKKKNYSTSLVHTMLSMTIFEMIARCECFIFIESDASIDFNKLRSDNIKTQLP